MRSFIFLGLILLVSLKSHSHPISAVQEALNATGIKSQDSLENKIDKILWLLNERRYFYPQGPWPTLPPPLDVPYHLDSLRTAEQILSQKVGGYCGSSALAFAAILNLAGINESDLQIVNAVVNSDLPMICPRAGVPRVDHPKTGASGHVFVAVRFPNKEWKIINTTDGSRNYGRARWYSPERLKEMIQTQAVAVPAVAFESLPVNPYGYGLSVFQTWSISEIQLHTYAQRFDLIASGRIDSEENPDVSVKVCRFASPLE